MLVCSERLQNSGKHIGSSGHIYKIISVERLMKQLEEDNMSYVCMLSAVVNSASEKTSMSDDLKGAIITALVTGMISIIGFIVTNTSMKKVLKTN